MSYRFVPEKSYRRTKFSFNATIPLVVATLAILPAALVMLVLLLMTPARPTQPRAFVQPTLTSTLQATPIQPSATPALPATPAPVSESQPRTAQIAHVQNAAPAQVAVQSPLKQDPIPAAWDVQYFQDRDQDTIPISTTQLQLNLTPGEPRLQWDDSQLPYEIQAPNYRVVFSITHDFAKTRSYLFVLRVKGIARVYLDGAPTPAIDMYRIGNKRPESNRIPLTAGLHTVRVEFYSDGGPASVVLYWDEDTKRNDYWLARYYNNQTMTAPPALIRHDTNLTFDWGDVPGHDVNPDGFSVQWLREVVVPRNGYTCRMSTTENDKVRVFVDGVLVPELSNWDAPNTWERVAKIPAGRHLVEVHFVNQAGPAKIGLICEL